MPSGADDGMPPATFFVVDETSEKNRKGKKNARYIYWFVFGDGNIIRKDLMTFAIVHNSEMDGWGDDGHLIRKGSVVHALALSAARFKEKDNKGKQRFPAASNRASSRRSSQKLGIGSYSSVINLTFKKNET